MAAIIYLCYLLAFAVRRSFLIIMAALVLAYSFLLNRTVFSRHIYAMGGNLNAARTGERGSWPDCSWQAVLVWLTGALPRRK